MRFIFTFKYTIKIIIRQPIDNQFKRVIMKAKKGDFYEARTLFWLAF